MDRPLWMLTFYDIRLNTKAQCINLWNLVTAFVRRHIFLQQHLTRHEHDTVARAPCLNLMLRCIVVNSEMPIAINKNCFIFLTFKPNLFTSFPMIAMHTAIARVCVICSMNTLLKSRSVYTLGDYSYRHCDKCTPDIQLSAPQQRTVNVKL